MIAAIARKRNIGFQPSFFDMSRSEKKEIKISHYNLIFRNAFLNCTENYTYCEKQNVTKANAKIIIST